MKKINLSVAITFIVALLLSPLARLNAANDCGMLGASAAQSKNCHGCCVQMPCCADSKPDDKSSPASAPNNRGDSGFSIVLAVPLKPSSFVYVVPPDRKDLRPVDQRSLVPVFSSLDRLCVRLI